MRTGKSSVQASQLHENFLMPELELLQTIEKHRIVVENSRDLVAVVDLRGRIVYLSPSTEHIIGYQPAELLGTSSFALLHPEDRKLAMRAMKQVLKGASREKMIIRMQHKDGRWLFLESTGSIIFAGKAKVPLAVASCHDVTEQLQAEEQLRKSEESFRLLTESLPQMVWTTTATGQADYYNKRWKEYTGYSPEQLDPKNAAVWRSIIHPDDYRQSLGRFRQAMENEQPYESECRFRRHKDGTYRWHLSRISPLRNKQGKVVKWLGSCTDIDDHKRNTESARRLALYDPLTQLPNRLLLSDRLRQAMSSAKRKGHSVGILVVDLDRFKDVNDTYGHQAGDRLLRQVAKRFQKLLRIEDTVARFGGDEFLILLPSLKSNEDLEEVAQKILDSFQSPFQLSGQRIQVGVSIGMASYPKDGDTLDELFRNADNALYHTKENGKNSYTRFNHAVRDRATERLNERNDLQQAIQQNELRVYYQPIVELASGTLVQAEALVRWQHPKKGLLPPNRFIKLAEETGLISALGEVVLEQTCQEMRRWQDEALFLPSVAVNVSPLQLLEPSLARKFEKRIKQAGLPAAKVQIEITEGAMQDLRTVQDQLKKMRKVGIEVAIDDFGIDYSSLSHLKRLPIDHLKIDRSFVKAALTDVRDRAIIQAIVAIAKTLGLKTYAEGIETVEQLHFLQDLGCEYGQGYYFSHPLPAADFRSYLRTKQAL